MSNNCGVRRWTVSSGWLLLVAVLAACSGPSTEGPTAISTSSAVASGIPAHEEFAVSVGAQRIAIQCVGASAGKPTIVLFHANGGNGQFDLVLPHLLTLSRVCVYDRPGTGSSPAPRQLPRSVEDVVDEARAVVTAAKIPAPVFLVGASEGAALAIMYAQAEPSGVAGLVAINPNPPYRQWITAAKKVETPEEIANLEEPDYRGANPEQIDNRGDSSMLEKPLPASIPYAVMFDENCDGNVSFCARVFPPLRELTARLAGAGAGGRFVPVPGAGHEIATTRPDEVNRTVDVIWQLATGS